MKKLNIRKSTVLTTINSVGVIITAVLSSVAAVKAKQKLDEQEEPIDTKTKVKIVAPYYIPTTISAAVTIGAGVAANKIDGTAIAALGVVGAKAVKDLKEYRSAVVAIDGEEKDRLITEYLQDRNLIEDQDGDLETCYWFYDPWDEIWFQSSKSDVANGWAELNRVLTDPNASGGNFGTPTMSDFYMGCGREEYINDTTYRMGWDMDDLSYNRDCYGLYFWLAKCDDNGNSIVEDVNANIDNGGPVKYRLRTFWDPRPLDEINEELIKDGYRE